MAAETIAINGTVISSTPTPYDFTLQPRPRTKAYFDLRTDATLDSEISVTVTAWPTLNGDVNGLSRLVYTSTIPVAQMNKVIEINFDTPVGLVRWTVSSSASKKLYLSMFDMLEEKV